MRFVGKDFWPRRKDHVGVVVGRLLSLGGSEEETPPQTSTVVLYLFSRHFCESVDSQTFWCTPPFYVQLLLCSTTG
jgi:hypothetical protein